MTSLRPVRPAMPHLRRPLLPWLLAFATLAGATPAVDVTGGYSVHEVLAADAAGADGASLVGGAQ